jgi:hypothetical protein
VKVKAQQYLRREQATEQRYHRTATDSVQHCQKRRRRRKQAEMAPTRRAKSLMKEPKKKPRKDL